MTTTIDHQDTHHTDQFTRKPLPTKSSRAARIWDRVADRYAAKPVANEEAYARKLAITRNYLHKDATVLELGCGTGSTALAHAPYVKHIKAVDFSSRMIAIARDKAEAADVRNIDFVCGAVNDVRAPEESIDTVLALSLLHLLMDWPDTIAAAHRLLKPGGVFVSSTICMKDGFTFMRPIASLGRRVGLIPTLSFFSRAELEHTISAAGFEIVHNWQPVPKSGVFIVARKTS